MATNYKLIQTIDGHNNGKTIAEYDTIEDAREALAETLADIADRSGGAYIFIGSEESREVEAEAMKDLYAEAIADIDDDAEDRDQQIAAERAELADRLDTISRLTVPCLISTADGYEEVAHISDDAFRYDNYTVEIVAEEEDDAPFEYGTNYPVQTQSIDGSNKWVEYTDGCNLRQGMTPLCPFAEMDADFRERVLDNTEAEDHDAIASGTVYVDKYNTIYAVYYGD